MDKPKLYADFHIIQTVPPSCVNRDDTGSPKTAVYGGVLRARVSSQAWKRAARMAFQEQGKRTKSVVDIVAGYCGDATLAEKIVSAAGITMKKGKTSALFFISDRQTKALADLAVSGNFDKKLAQAALNNHPSIDIALFGRMVADDPQLNIDASCQVAHALSTHKVEAEFDYFTAVDDCSPADNAGAGMIGTVEYCSATLYRYATVAVHDLAEQLGGMANAADALREFAHAFITSMPTGKQNTFANRTLPDYVLLTLRADQPVNLVGAFETPVKSAGGFVAASIEKLTAYARDVYGKYCAAPKKSYIVGEGYNLATLLDALGEDVRHDLDA